jgi:ankyrin repeat protein
MKAKTDNCIRNFVKKIQKSTVSEKYIEHFLQYFDTEEKVERFNKYRVIEVKDDKQHIQPIIHWLISQNQSAILSKIIDANIFDHNVKDSEGRTAFQFVARCIAFKSKVKLMGILLESPNVCVTQKFGKSSQNIISFCITRKKTPLLIFILKTLINAQRKEDVIKLILDSRFDITHSKRYSGIITLLEEKGMSDVLEITRSKATPYNQAEEPQAEIVSDSESSSDIDIRQASDQIPPPLEHLQQAMLESDVESHTALTTVLESEKPQQPEVSMEVISNYLEKHRFGLTIHQTLQYIKIYDHLTQHRLGPFGF